MAVVSPRMRERHRPRVGDGAPPPWAGPSLHRILWLDHASRAQSTAAPDPVKACTTPH
jgi:hypothetical protein